MSGGRWLRDVRARKSFPKSPLSPKRPIGPIFVRQHPEIERIQPAAVFDEARAAVGQRVVGSAIAGVLFRVGGMAAAFELVSIISIERVHVKVAGVSHLLPENNRVRRPADGVLRHR